MRPRDRQPTRSRREPTNTKGWSDMGKSKKSKKDSKSKKSDKKKGKKKGKKGKKK